MNWQQVLWAHIYPFTQDSQDVHLTHIMLYFVVILPDKIILWGGTKNCWTVSPCPSLSLHSSEGNSHDKKRAGVYINILSFYSFHSLKVQILLRGV